MTLAENLRANPIPATMIGIGVVGWAWLAFGRTQPRPKHIEEWDGSAALAGDDPAYGAPPLDPLQYSWLGDTANRYAPGFAYGDSDPLRGPVRSGSGVDRGSIAARSRHYWQSANRFVKHRAWTVRDRFHYWLQTNPLLIGAAAAVIGAAVGSALLERDESGDFPAVDR